MNNTIIFYKKIQETYKDTYSQENFDTASEEITRTMMRKMLTSGEKKSNFTLDKTYRNFLDEARKIDSKERRSKQNKMRNRTYSSWIGSKKTRTDWCSSAYNSAVGPSWNMTWYILHSINSHDKQKYTPSLNTWWKYSSNFLYENAIIDELFYCNNTVFPRFRKKIFSDVTLFSIE